MRDRYGQDSSVERHKLHQPGGPGASFEFHWASVYRHRDRRSTGSSQTLQRHRQPANHRAHESYLQMGDLDHSFQIVLNIFLLYDDDKSWDSAGSLNFYLHIEVQMPFRLRDVLCQQLSMPTQSRLIGLRLFHVRRGNQNAATEMIIHQIVFSQLCQGINYFYREVKLQWVFWVMWQDL